MNEKEIIEDEKIRYKTRQNERVKEVAIFLCIAGAITIILVIAIAIYIVGG
jgi:hypothetical protein